MNEKKLYELNNKTWFRLAPEEVHIPPDAPKPDFNQKYRLTNIDGMYSHVVGEDNYVYHFAAWTKVEEVPAP